MKFFIKSYKDVTQHEKKDILIMLSQVWPSFTDCHEIHPQQSNVQSLYLYDHQKVIAYTGIILQTIPYQNQILTTASLSCVAVLKAYRGKGIGQMIINKATEWIESQSVALGIFTCHRSLVDFYIENRCWNIADEVILKGNHNEASIASDQIDVIVLIACFLAGLEIKKTTFYLNLPDGQFV